MASYTVGTGVLDSPRKTNGGTKAPPYEYDYNPHQTVGANSVRPQNKRTVGFSLRLGHARVLTSHRDVIHCARAASLRRSLQSYLKFIIFLFDNYSAQIAK